MNILNILRLEGLGYRLVWELLDGPKWAKGPPNLGAGFVAESASTAQE